MNQINDMTRTDWTPAAESTSSTKDVAAASNASDSSVSFKKLMGEKKTEKAEGQTAKKETDGQAKATEKDEGQEALCQAVAASMTTLANPTAPILLQSQAVIPEQAAAVPTFSAQTLPVATGEPALPQNVVLPGQQQTEPTAAYNLPAQPQPEALKTEGDQADLVSLKTVTQTGAKDAAAVATSMQSEGAELNQGQSGQQEQDGDPQFQSSQTVSAQPLFRNVESAPVKVGAPQPEAAQTNDQTSGLADQITKALGQGEQRVELHLTPENLGSVVVDLTWKQDGSLQVTLHTATARASALLTEHAGELGGMLQNNTQSNVQVEVQQQTESQQFQQNEQNAQHGQHSQQERRQQQSENFLQQLRLGLVSMDEELSG